MHLWIYRIGRANLKCHFLWSIPYVWNSRRAFEFASLPSTTNKGGSHTSSDDIKRWIAKLTKSIKTEKKNKVEKETKRKMTIYTSICVHHTNQIEWVYQSHFDHNFDNCQEKKIDRQSYKKN